ncbi:helix-turn-helix transcriptional regulator [Acrocarpospora macrocephala]|uniref:helix-turn-helix transcriptional regulator n=1 Tax=Acrocarpospora macrocephala TaxID=150177 RepID=UPI0014794AE1|nr:LuxR C-terminal-related transcriptional regulator [Acrocarpospora macrocephala]
MQKALLHAMSPLAVLEAASEALLAAVPADVWCAVMLDPATLLDTGGIHREGFPEGSMRRLFELEHVQQDHPSHLRLVAVDRDRVNLLSRTPEALTGAYYQDILAPLGLADELRVVLRERKRVWGLLVWCRAAGSPGFDSQELDIARALAVPAATALRQSLVLAGIDTGELPDAPGRLTLGPSLDLHSSSPSADRWLAEYQNDGDRPLPYALQALAVRATGLPPGVEVHSLVPIPSGRFMSLRAWSVPVGGTNGVAMSLARGEPNHLVPLILDIYGFSPAERRIIELVLHGRSIIQISRQLERSEHTISKQLANAYQRVGVNSREELMSALFFRHYLPQFPRPDLTTDGRLFVAR